MNLSISDRYILLELLPKEGSYSTLKIVRQLRESLSFTEEELARFEIKEESIGDGRINVTWRRDVPQETDIPFKDKALEIIRDSLRQLDREKKITDREFLLYEKFVVD